ncbi:hypothetical protein GIW58_04555, partial [Pseudomonas gessardii]|nr:hypothetical protein [Pseudomonas gessardii]
MALIILTPSLICFFSATLRLYSLHKAKKEAGPMGVYNYKDLGDDESRALSVDALALISTSGISEQSNEIIASVVREAGWTPLSGSTLGYDGSLSSRGAFTGEKAGYATAEAEVLGKYDASGKLTGLGVM